MKKNKNLVRDWGYGKKRYLKSLKRKDKVYDPKKKIRVKKFNNAYRIYAPEKISIYECEDANPVFLKTIEFFHDIDMFLGKKKCLIDFSKTKSVSAAALLMLYAHIESAQKNGIARSSYRSSRVSDEVNRALFFSNVTKLIRDNDFKFEFPDGNILPVVSSHDSEHREKIIDHIQKEVFKDSMNEEKEFVFSGAVVEAINNVHFHAYPDVNSERKWWLISSVMDNQLYLAIYDKGIGIPETAINKIWFKNNFSKAYPDIYRKLEQDFPGGFSGGFTKLLKTLSDEIRIYISMMGDMSSTGESKHWQGSKSIKKLVSETDDGKLWVFSNKGLYKFAGKTQMKEAVKLPRPIIGTLVQWNIKLNDEKSN